MPKEVELGSSADLSCDWRLNGEKKLYSVKWYKDDHEFFRFSPDIPERMQTFPQSGIQLDVSSDHVLRYHIRPPCSFSATSTLGILAY